MPKCIFDHVEIRILGIDIQDVKQEVGEDS